MSFDATDVLKFLHQSNLIEGVTDADSLLQSYYAWDCAMERDELSTGLILRAHKIIMLHQPISPLHRGHWRNCAVSIGGEVACHYSTVDGRMVQWVNKWKLANLEEAIRQAHVEFEHIHPFVDGNGRTGRLVLNWQRVKAGLPILIIEDENKGEYYQWFRS